MECSLSIAMISRLIAETVKSGETNICEKMSSAGRKESALTSKKYRVSSPDVSALLEPP